jgi:ppGpp synthetase/RelA/SpoT-type nucleotidyltranferase
MNLIEKEMMKIKFIIDQYSDDRKDVYEGITNTITEKLKKIIDELAPKLGLVSNTSVRKIKHYSFSPRVKDAESLKEKLIRNNLYNEFETFIPDGFSQTDPNLINTVKAKLLENDDLIGIKILTDLNSDSIKMFDLLSSFEFQSKAKAQNISLEEADLKDQPQSMKNGLDIYKIGCRYDKYKFELQIKSKIISAWGDMEHSIFYKDYAISPVRDTAKKSMNHVGKLLFQIDDFVESIRNANKDYSKNAYALIFMQWFDGKYSSKIKSTLDDVGYRMDGISELLYAAYKHLKVTDTISENPLRFEHFEFDVNSEFLKKYISNRNQIYDLKILEAIVMSWCLDAEVEIIEANMEDNLTIYLNVLIESTSKFLLEKHTGYEHAEMVELVQLYYKTGFKYDCSEKFLLSLNKFSSYLDMSFVVDDISDTNLDFETILIIKKLIFINLNNGNTITASKDFLESSGPIARDDFKKSLIRFNELLESKKDKKVLELTTVINKLIDSI